MPEQENRLTNQQKRKKKQTNRQAYKNRIKY